MGGEWREITVGELAPFAYGKALPEARRNVNGNVPVYGSNGVVGFHDAPLTGGPTVVIGRKGTVGAVHYSPVPCWPIDTTFFVSGSDPWLVRYRYYVLKSLGLEHMNADSAVPGLNRDAAHARQVSVPANEDEQRAIAHILGTLDDKIELNRRMNRTLEAMARALFKSWFIDFDPVRAKCRGGPPWPPPIGPAHVGQGQAQGPAPTGWQWPQHILDLFPARLVDSELGEIPEGWEVKKLSDLCSTQYGYTASAVDEPIGPKFLRVTDINKRNWIEWNDVPHCEIDQDTKEAYALKMGDLVVARMADPGKSAIIEEEIDAMFASYLVRLQAQSLAHSYYVYGFLKSDLYAQYAEGARSGSVQANMNAKVIVGVSLAVPPTKVMKQFLRAVLPLRQRLVSNVRESRALADLRDALLPKLISGELRVKEAERFLKERGL